MLCILEVSIQLTKTQSYFPGRGEGGRNKLFAVYFLQMHFVDALFHKAELLW